MRQKSTVRSFMLILLLATIVPESGPFNTIVSAKDESSTDLIRAIRDGQKNRIDDLIEHGADVNAQDDYERTPLIYAIFRKDMEVVDKLLLHNANVNLQDREGITPLIAALEGMQLPTPDPGSAPIASRADFASSVAMKLLAHGADFNQADNAGKTPLFFASKSGSLLANIVIELLKRGADPNRADNEGIAPLMIAVAGNSFQNTSALLLAKANPNQADKQGRTPMYFLHNPEARYTEWAPAGSLSSCADPITKPSSMPPDQLEKIEQTMAMRNAEVAKLLKNAGASDQGVHAIPMQKPIYAQPRSAPETMAKVSRILPENGIYEGAYVLRLLVGADGEVKKAEVLSGIPDGISERLAEAAIGLQFTPGMKNSRTVDCWTIRFGFSRRMPAQAAKTSGEFPNTVGNGVKPPVVLSRPLPSYTDEARAAHVEGVVVLQVIIRKDGTVDSFKILKSLGYGLDESAMKTIAESWRFQPGTLNGQPVDVMANIQVSFKLFK
jgi:TonB family protein